VLPVTLNILNYTAEHYGTLKQKTQINNQNRHNN
jgi:hypothetical protein